MRSQFAFVVLNTLLAVEAAPQHARSSVNVARQTNGTGQASIPQIDSDPRARAAGVATRRAGFLYGPSLIGEASFFLNGTLGEERVLQDLALWDIDRKAIEADIKADIGLVKTALVNVGIFSLPQRHSY